VGSGTKLLHHRATAHCLCPASHLGNWTARDKGAAGGVVCMVLGTVKERRSTQGYIVAMDSDGSRELSCRERGQAQPGSRGICGCSLEDSDPKNLKQSHAVAYFQA
jgi:hypothetical protein